MTAKNEKSKKSLNAESLERQLRAFPQPETPPGLEQKLLSSIPSGREISKSRPPVSWRWAVAASAAAAAIILIGILVVSQKSMPTPATTIAQMSQEDIEQTIEREGIAAQLLASARILGDAPGGKRDAAEIQQYITIAYADTSAAKQLLESTSFKSGDTP